MAEDLTRADTHFGFGKNWASYANLITHAQVDEAVRGLEKLLDGKLLAGKSFFDIGSGSGLHALAALRLGAKEVLAIDIDADSVETTRAVLDRFAPGAPWRVERASVFDLDPAVHGHWDVVYSWGVLHHTGDLNLAIRKSAALVAPAGHFVFALYRRIWMDWFWKIEKRWYAQASVEAQARARSIYRAFFRLGLTMTGRRFADYVAAYRSNRGMDFDHDVHDWMGGWPYESILPAEVDAIMRPLGFEAVRVLARRGKLLGRNPGVFGSGCDEYVYRRMA